MPRSNVTGGKHHKKGKKHKGPVNVNQDNKIEYAGVNQVYALVKKKVGGSRLLVECSDGKERSGLIPGRFFKKVWMNAGDIVLCDLNIESDDTICYINMKYTTKDANVLKSQGKISFDIAEEKEEMGGFKYVTDPKESKSENNRKNGTNIIDSDSCSDNDDNLIDHNDDIFEIKNPNRKNVLGKQNKNNKFGKDNKSKGDKSQDDKSKDDKSRDDDSDTDSDSVDITKL